MFHMKRTKKYARLINGVKGRLLYEQLVRDAMLQFCKIKIKRNKPIRLKDRKTTLNKTA